MARKNASNLDNQISLLDMMVSESPEYSEEKPKENQEISENAKNDTEQTGEPSHPKTSKPAKARASISTQTLKVVKALYTDTVETNWEDLFDGFDRLYAITFSSGIEFVNKVINKFSYAEVVFGCEKIITRRGKEHEELLAIRNGKYMREDGTYEPAFFDMVDSFEARFQKAVKESVLPAKPNMQKIEELLVAINKSYLSRTM